ncbi:Hypothetical_protein [Hexamita inflata]|uniref:Hypothetical_protein n=1 Tax=Hexamita inflata TaxID=28002 RepID=A0AA86QTW8_9EUKA|nr:Hypothetical protein HINF_LOCUS47138 [Hexamita inflata]
MADKIEEQNTTKQYTYDSKATKTSKEITKVQNSLNRMFNSITQDIHVNQRATDTYQQNKNEDSQNMNITLFETIEIKRPCDIILENKIKQFINASKEIEKKILINQENQKLNLSQVQLQKQQKILNMKQNHITKVNAAKLERENQQIQLNQKLKEVSLDIKTKHDRIKKLVPKPKQILTEQQIIAEKNKLDQFKEQQMLSKQKQQSLQNSQGEQSDQIIQKTRNKSLQCTAFCPPQLKIQSRSQSNSFEKEMQLINIQKKQQEQQMYSRLEQQIRKSM